MTTLAEDGPELRRDVIATALAMNAAGINVNKSGNVSARCIRGTVRGFVVTPTGIPYRDLEADDIVFVRTSGEVAGNQAPSSEWRFHRDIYAARPEFGAIVHTHSRHATALACHGRGLPAFHYMVAMAGGPDIRCSPYATFGTQALSDHALRALAGRRACLLAHHGAIACGEALDTALALAIEVEHLAAIYLAARALGEPPLLAADEMQRVIDRFRTYGPQAARRHGP
jgi:L-fuculose-phosphate aldolase